MDIKAKIIENSGKIKLNELKIQALMNILTKEGIITNGEVENELNELVNKEKKEDSEEK